jgi:hypothetical protein
MVASLRADRQPDGCERDVGDPWALLDPDALRARELSIAAEILRAEHAALVACQRYERTRRASYLRDAVVELETAVRVEREPLCARIPKAARREEGDRLERALRQALPSPAFRFLATKVREAIAQVVAEETPHSRAPGSEFELLISRETWTQGLDEDKAAGIWFIDWFQRRYEDETERHRLDEDADGRSRWNAVQSPSRWQAERDETRIRRAAGEALEGRTDSEASSPQASIAPEEEHAPRVQLPPAPKIPSDYVAWPFHAEENARLNEAVQQAASAEWEEFVQARQLLASKEAERIWTEVEERRRLEAFEAKRARKASPARVQSGGALARLERP